MRGHIAGLILAQRRAAKIEALEWAATVVTSDGITTREFIRDKIARLKGEAGELQ